MKNLAALPHRFDPEKLLCDVIIEAPKGSRNKYKYNPESGVFELSGVLPEGMIFPLDFGFIPSTLGEDGDPLDIMALTDAPVCVGALVHVRIVGILEARQMERGKSERNDRLIGVAIPSYEYENTKSLEDLSKTAVAQIEEFFVSYNRQRGKKFTILAASSPKKAARFLKQGIEAQRKATQQRALG
jgi:inorganic pyrophosphatase